MRIGRATRRNAGLVGVVMALGCAAACTSILGDLPGGSLLDAGAGDGTTMDGPAPGEGGMDVAVTEGGTDSSSGGQDSQGTDTGSPLDSGTHDADAEAGPGPDPIVSLATGASACAVKKSGALYCWGNNTNGTVGDGTTIDRAIPVLITKDSTGAALPPMAQVSAGLGHVCALSKTGTVYCWGNDDAGQLGDGVALPIDAGTGNQGRPKLVPNVQNASQVGTGLFHTCAVTTPKIVCWGSNGYGELGHTPGTMGDIAINAFFYNWANPAPTVGFQLFTPMQLSLGAMFSCVNDTGAQDPFCWGDDYNGQLGEGAPDAAQTWTPTPLEVQVAGNASLGLQKEIATSSFSHGCAVDGAGNLSCWGDNGAGQLGPSLAVAGGNFSVAFTVMTSSVAHVSVSLWTTCIVDISQHVQCWGANQSGVLGHDPSMDPFSSCPGNSGPCNPNPSTIMSGTLAFGPAQSISVGIGFACSLKNDGTLWCWGQGGSVGNGDGDDAGLEFSPVQVTGLP